MRVNRAVTRDCSALKINVRYDPYNKNLNKNSELGYYSRMHYDTMPAYLLT